MKKTVTLSVAGLFASLCIVGMITCGPKALQVENMLGVTLSLEQEGKTTATYYGNPITAIITFPDSVIYSNIQWHYGIGERAPSAIPPNQKVLSIEQKFSWNLMPAKRDTATGNY